MMAAVVVVAAAVGACSYLVLVAVDAGCVAAAAVVDGGPRPSVRCSRLLVSLMTGVSSLAVVGAVVDLLVVDSV